MDNVEKRIGYCSNCGKELAVPVNLAKFSCMYCGAILTQDDLVMEPAVFDATALDEIKGKLADCILENKEIMKKFNRNEYETSFEDYCKQYRPLFNALDECYTAAAPEDKADIIKNSVEAFMADIAADVSAAPKAAGEIDKLRYVIALYFVPMVRALCLKVSDPFCFALRDKWASTYPKYRFEVGAYDAIASGFKKKFLGLCFITTAVCEHSGKADDCYELTAFRSFRDGYLASSEGGKELIDEYYETAPVIVTCIDLLCEKDDVYPMLRKKYLTPCLEDIEQGRFEDCKNRYVDMVRTLQRRYLKQ